MTKIVKQNKENTYTLKKTPHHTKQSKQTKITKLQDGKKLAETEKELRENRVKHRLMMLYPDIENNGTRPKKE